MIIKELTDKKLIKLVHDSGCYELQQRIEFNWKDCDGSLGDSELEKLISECENIIFMFECDGGFIEQSDEDEELYKRNIKECKATKKLLKKLLALQEKE